MRGQQAERPPLSRDQENNQAQRARLQADTLNTLVQFGDSVLHEPGLVPVVLAVRQRRHVRRCEHRQIGRQAIRQSRPAGRQEIRQPGRISRRNRTPRCIARMARQKGKPREGQRASEKAGQPGAYSCCLLAAQRTGGTEPREQPEATQRSKGTSRTPQTRGKSERERIKLTVVKTHGVVSTMCQLSKCSRSRNRS